MCREFAEVFTTETRQIVDCLGIKTLWFSFNDQQSFSGVNVGPPSLQLDSLRLFGEPGEKIRRFKGNGIPDFARR
jgi:hypothetical protein